MPSKPSRRPVADPIPHSGGYYAVWALPGMIPDFVYDLDAGGNLTNRRTNFSSEAEAIDAARKIMIDAFFKRSMRKFEPSSQKKVVSIKPTADEFAVLLAEAGLEPDVFADLWGTSTDRVLAWLDGEQEVPFPIRWVLELMKEPGAVDKAIAVSEKFLRDRAPVDAFKKKQDRMKALIAHIRRNLPKNPDETTFRFDAVLSPECLLNIDGKIKELEEITRDLGAPLAADSRTPVRG